MGKRYDFDYIVIGSGPAGRTSAYNLAKGRKRVALVDEQSLSGADSNRDIPYLINLDFSHTYHHFNNLPAISGQYLHYNLPAISSHQEHIVSLINDKNTEILNSAGITILNGNANFIDENTIAIGNNQYTASNFIIATGSKLKTTGIAGLETVNYLTPSTALKVRRMPKFVFVVGGGPTGCEIAQYYAELGAKVIIMERGPHLLPHEDREVGECLSNYFINELGMMIIPNSKVIALEQDNISKRVIFTTGRQEKFVRVDCIVLATGSEPAIDLSLENAGVDYKNTGILVDKYFQTSAKHIYAIGDVIDPNNSSTERARYEASILTTNLLHKTKTTPDYTGFIRNINTFPEVAVVGFNDYDLLERDRKYRKAITKLDELPISGVLNFDYGFVKLTVDNNNRIQGASIVAPNALLLAEEIALAIRNRISAVEIANMPKPIHSYSYAIKLTAQKLTK